MAKKDDTEAEAIIEGVGRQKTQSLQIMLRQEGEGRSANEVYNMSGEQLRAAADADGVINRAEVNRTRALVNNTNEEEEAEATRDQTDSEAWESTWDEMWKRGTWAKMGKDEPYRGDDISIDDFIHHRAAEIWRIERDVINGQLTDQDPAVGRGEYNPEDLTDDQVAERMADLAAAAAGGDLSMDIPYRGPNRAMDPNAPEDPPTPPDTPPGQTPPGDTPPADTPPGDTPPADTPSGDPPPAGTNGGGGGGSGGGGGDDDGGGGGSSGGPPAGSTKYSWKHGVGAESGYKDEDGNWYNEDGTPMDPAKAERAEDGRDLHEGETVPEDDGGEGEAGGDDDDNAGEDKDVDRSEDPTGDNYQPTEEDLESAQSYQEMIRAGRTPIDPPRDGGGEPVGDAMWPVRPGVDNPGPFGETADRSGDGRLSPEFGFDPTHTDPLPDEDFGSGEQGPYQDEEISDLLDGDEDLSHLNPGAGAADDDSSDEDESPADQPVGVVGTAGFMLEQAPFDASGGAQAGDPADPEPDSRDDQWSQRTIDTDTDDDPRVREVADDQDDLFD